MSPVVALLWSVGCQSRSAGQADDRQRFIRAEPQCTPIGGSGKGCCGFGRDRLIDGFAQEGALGGLTVGDDGFQDCARRARYGQQVGNGLPTTAGDGQNCHERGGVDLGDESSLVHSLRRKQKSKVKSLGTEFLLGFSLGGSDRFGEHSPELGCFVYEIGEAVRRKRLGFGQQTEPVVGFTQFLERNL